MSAIPKAAPHAKAIDLPQPFAVFFSGMLKARSYCLSESLPCHETGPVDASHDAEAEAWQLVELLSEQVVALEGMSRATDRQGLHASPASGNPFAPPRQSFDHSDGAQLDGLRERLLQMSVALLRDRAPDGAARDIEQAMQRLGPDDPACGLLRRVRAHRAGQTHS